MASSIGTPFITHLSTNMNVFKFLSPGLDILMSNGLIFGSIADGKAAYRSGIIGFIKLSALMPTASAILFGVSSTERRNEYCCGIGLKFSSIHLLRFLLSLWTHNGILIWLPIFLSLMLACFG